MRGLFFLALLLTVKAVHAASSSASDLPLKDGRTLAQIHCVTCHLLPEPDAVDRATWEQQILPRMKWRLGFTTPELDRSPNVQLLRAHQRIPLQPVITEEEWERLVDYYLGQAPVTPVPQDPRPMINLGVPGFKVVLPVHHATNPAVTALKILPGGGAILADDIAKEARVLNRSGTLVETLPLGNAVSSFHIDGSSIVAAGLGSFVPSDSTEGAVYVIGRTNGQWRVEDRPLQQLPRTTDAWRADLNGDGRPDYAVSIFGNNIGRFSWYQSAPGGGYLENVLFALPGTLRAEFADVTGDGRPDLIALVAQETEALIVFPNLGGGRFDQMVVFQRPPYWGHSYFEIADFNRDGRPDFLVTNGDNGEFSSPPKRVHGVRIYTAQASGGWKETWFFPMNGAYKAVARDFDGDGDLDIAAISYYPDYLKAPRESFVYLRNDGENRFVPFTFAESALGRWICMDAGDFDGDGRDDILLGSCIKGPTAVPTKLMDAWKQIKLPVLLLRNEGSSVNAAPR